MTHPVQFIRIASMAGLPMSQAGKTPGLVFREGFIDLAETEKAVVVSFRYLTRADTDVFGKLYEVIRAKYDTMPILARIHEDQPQLVIPYNEKEVDRLIGDGLAFAFDNKAFNAAIKPIMKNLDKVEAERKAAAELEANAARAALQVKFDHFLTINPTIDQCADITRSADDSNGILSTVVYGDIVKTAYVQAGWTKVNAEDGSPAYNVDVMFNGYGADGNLVAGHYKVTAASMTDALLRYLASHNYLEPKPVPATPETPVEPATEAAATVETAQ